MRQRVRLAAVHVPKHAAPLRRGKSLEQRGLLPLPLSCGPPGQHDAFAAIWDLLLVLYVAVFLGLFADDTGLRVVELDLVGIAGLRALTLSLLSYGGIGPLGSVRPGIQGRWNLHNRMLSGMNSTTCSPTLVQIGFQPGGGGARRGGGQGAATWKWNSSRLTSTLPATKVMTACGRGTTTISSFFSSNASWRRAGGASSILRRPLGWRVVGRPLSVTSL